MFIAGRTKSLFLSPTFAPTLGGLKKGNAQKLLLCRDGCGEKKKSKKHANKANNVPNTKAGFCIVIWGKNGNGREPFLSFCLVTRDKHWLETICLSPVLFYGFFIFLDKTYFWTDDVSPEMSCVQPMLIPCYQAKTQKRLSVIAVFSQITMQKPAYVFGTSFALLACFF